jgi:hypothetical protein
VRLGILYIETERHAEALPMLEKALEEEGWIRPKFWNCAGFCMRKKGIGKSRRNLSTNLLLDSENENAAEGLKRIERLPGLGASILGNKSSLLKI